MIAPPGAEQQRRLLAVWPKSALLMIGSVLLLWAAWVFPAAAEAKHVVLLFDERPGLPGMAAVETSFVNTLTSHLSDRLEVYREGMDLSRFGTSAYRTRLRDFLQAKYADKKIDLVVAVMGPALDFLLDNADQIFPGAPIVFCGVDKREIASRSLPPHVSGIFLRRMFKPTLKVALELHPDVRHIVVIAGKSPFDSRVLEAAKKEWSEYEGRFTFRYLIGTPLPELLREVSRLPPRTVVLFTTFFQDATGEPFVPYDVVGRASAAANAPVYGFIDQYLGHGIVGGSLYSIDEQGPAAARLASEILTNANPTRATLLDPDLNQLLFDWRQLQRWNISEKKLPAGSQIRFRPSGVWEQHRTFVIAVSAVLASMTAILGALLLQISRRKKAEVSLRQSEERLKFSAASTNTGLWQLNLRTGEFWATEQCRAMFGLTPKTELKPQTFLRAVHRDDRSIIAAAIRLVRHGASDVKSAEFRILHPDGFTRWILAASRLHLDSEGTPRSVSGVFRDVTARKTAEHEAEQLSERLLAIQDEERQQIAVELHDSTTQHLAAAILNMMSIQGRLSSDPKTRELCNDVERSLEEATKELRAYVYLLNPPQLAKDGLRAALERYVDGFSRRTGIEAKLRASPAVDGLLPLSAERALLRIVQEGLANVHRHADTAHVSIDIKIVRDQVHLLVVDDGKGMAVVPNGHFCETPRAGVGIPGMKARLRRLGGDLKILSGAGGTKLHGVIPVREKKAIPSAEVTWGDAHAH